MKMEETLGSSPSRQRKRSRQGRDGRQQMVLTFENLSASHGGTGVMGRDAIAEGSTRRLRSTDVNMQIKGFSYSKETNKIPKNILIES